MKKIEKRVTDNQETMIDNHRTAIDGVKRMMKSTRNEAEKRKLKDIITRLEKDIDTIQSEGIAEFNRKKAIIRKLDALKAEFNKLYDGN